METNLHCREHIQGFTLLEMSIVVIIIGLIVGGVLVGRDLVNSSKLRGQIAQVDKYHAAVADFRNKYGGLPGDLPLYLANQFGFNSGPNCDATAGKRNGDGLITGYSGNMGIVWGESGLFWQDLSTAGSIDGTFPSSGAAYVDCTSAAFLNLKSGATSIGDYLPSGKIGYGTFLYVYNDLNAGGNGYNWYGLSTLTQVSTTNLPTSSAGIPVIQAYNIDAKIDDGLPTTGIVQANYLNGSVTVIQQSPNAASDSSATCYNTTSNTYSTSAAANGGTGKNCALSFQFVQPQ